MNQTEKRIIDILIHRTANDEIKWTSYAEGQGRYTVMENSIFKIHAQIINGEVEITYKVYNDEYVSSWSILLPFGRLYKLAKLAFSKCKSVNEMDRFIYFVENWKGN